MITIFENALMIIPLNELCDAFPWYIDDLDQSGKSTAAIFEQIEMQKVINLKNKVSNNRKMA